MLKAYVLIETEAARWPMSPRRSVILMVCSRGHHRPLRRHRQDPGARSGSARAAGGLLGIQVVDGVTRTLDLHGDPPVAA